MIRSFLFYAWVIVLVGSLVSLYYGEILLMEPCTLCWYQRIAWFSLTVILGTGVYYNDLGAVRYARLFVWFGALVALYHSIISHIPSLSYCKVDCVNSFFTLVPWLSFPDVSLFGLIAVIVLLYKAKKGLAR